MGPLDWTLRFEFTHRELSGIPGSIDFDADRYLASFRSGWYATENLQIALGVRWERDEAEFTSTEDVEGLFEARFFSAFPIIPIELRLGASAGVSEFKQSPFRGDRRGVYGAHAGIVLRFGAGRTLLETQRAYD